MLKLKNLRPKDFADYTCQVSVRNVCNIEDKSVTFRLTNTTSKLFDCFPKTKQKTSTHLRKSFHFFSVSRVFHLIWLFPARSLCLCSGSSCSLSLSLIVKMSPIFTCSGNSILLSSSHFLSSFNPSLSLFLSLSCSLCWVGASYDCPEVSAQGQRWGRDYLQAYEPHWAS